MEAEKPAAAKPTTGKGSPKGGRPRKPLDVAAVLASDEGRAAIAAAAQAVAGPLVAQIDALQKQIASLPMVAGPGANMDQLQAIFAQMGLSMASIADQGQRVVRVSPEEQLKRDAAKARMGELLSEAFENYREAQFRSDAAGMADWMPVYEVKVQTHIHDQLVQPFTDVEGVAEPTEIDWQGPPGPSLKPVNRIAKLIFEQYEIWIGGVPDTINGVAAQPQWVTLGKQNGLTVRTTAGARFRDGGPRRQVGGVPDSGETLNGPESGPAFAIRKRGANLKPKTRHVLGTVVQPARDMVPGEARRA